MTPILKTLFFPLSPESFVQDIFGKESFYMKADSNSSRQYFFGWKDLNTLLNLSSVWSQNSLRLIQNGLPIPAQRYCVPAMNREKQQVSMPDGGKIQGLIEKGADLICQDIDGLHPYLKEIAEQLEKLLHSKVQIDLYASWKSQDHSQPQFFHHEALVLQVEGTNSLSLYEEKAPNPIHHASVARELQKHSKTLKDKIAEEILLEPGAGLFIPRGQYHKMQSNGSPSLSLIFLMAQPVYLELVTLLFEHLALIPQARETLKLEDSSSQQADCFSQILAEAATSEDFKATLDHFKDQFRRPRSFYKEDTSSTEAQNTYDKAS
ncbi:MAG: hypothetical protein GY915_08350 [bacterium]|nr:hypothetical protein [bacterium]